MPMLSPPTPLVFPEKPVAPTPPFPPLSVLIVQSDIATRNAVLLIPMVEPPFPALGFPDGFPLPPAPAVPAVILQFLIIEGEPLLLMAIHDWPSVLNAPLAPGPHTITMFSIITLVPLLLMHIGFEVLIDPLLIIVLLTLPVIKTVPFRLNEFKLKATLEEVIVMLPVMFCVKQYFPGDDIVVALLMPVASQPLALQLIDAITEKVPAKSSATN